MELLEAIKGRHSVRKFKDEHVSREIMDDLITCGTLAPTASNMQAWRFIAVTDPALVKKVDMFSPGLAGSPTAIILLCADKDVALSRGGSDGVELAIVDLSLAAENIILRAVDLGLGSCCIESYNRKAVRKLLRVPENFETSFLIALGYPAAEPKSPKRKPLEEVIYYDVYEEK